MKNKLFHKPGIFVIGSVVVFLSQTLVLASNLNNQKIKITDNPRGRSDLMIAQTPVSSQAFQELNSASSNIERAIRIAERGIPTNQRSFVSATLADVASKLDTIRDAVNAGEGPAMTTANQAIDLLGGVERQLETDNSRIVRLHINRGINDLQRLITSLEQFNQNNPIDDVCQTNSSGIKVCQFSAGASGRRGLFY